MVSIALNNSEAKASWLGPRSPQREPLTECLKTPPSHSRGFSTVGKLLWHRISFRVTNMNVFSFYFTLEGSRSCPSA